MPSTMLSRKLDRLIDAAQGQVEELVDLMLTYPRLRRSAPRVRDRRGLRLVPTGRQAAPRKPKRRTALAVE